MSEKITKSGLFNGEVHCPIDKSMKIVSAVLEMDETTHTKESFFGPDLTISATVGCDGLNGNNFTCNKNNKTCIVMDVVSSMAGNLRDAIDKENGWD